MRIWTLVILQLGFHLRSHFARPRIDPGQGGPVPAAHAIFISFCLIVSLAFTLTCSMFLFLTLSNARAGPPLSPGASCARAYLFFQPSTFSLPLCLRAAPHPARLSSSIYILIICLCPELINAQSSLFAASEFNMFFSF